MWLWYAVFFALAAAGDIATVAWHRARERERVARVVVLSAALETLTWIPVWFALEWSDPWIAVASIGGASFGTALSFSK